MPLSRRYTPEWEPGENALVGLDYSFVVPPGVGLSSGGLSIWTNTVTPTDVSTSWTIGPVTVQGRAIYARLIGGELGKDYQLRWTAIDTDGNTFPRTALLLCALTS